MVVVTERAKTVWQANCSRVADALEFDQLSTLFGVSEKPSQHTLWPGFRFDSDRGEKAFVGAEPVARRSDLFQPGSESLTQPTLVSDSESESKKLT